MIHGGWSWRIGVIPASADTPSVKPCRTISDGVGPFADDSPEVGRGKGRKGLLITTDELNVDHAYILDGKQVNY